MKKSVTSISYIVSLVFVLMIPILCIHKTQNTLLMILVCIGIGILHFICFIGIGFYLEERVERAFRVEYKQIYQTYQANKDAEMFYNELMHMKHKAKTTLCKNTYYVSLSTAAYETNRGEESLSILYKISTIEDKNMQEVVIKQKKTIFEKYHIKDEV